MRKKKRSAICLTHGATGTAWIGMCSARSRWPGIEDCAPVSPGDSPMDDDEAVSIFATAMQDKMAKSRAKGRGGWQSCSVDDLWKMLREHVEKGDPVDVANLAMMIWHNER